MTVPWSETGSRRAPDRLVLVQAFVNTRDIEAGADTIDAPESLAAWLLRNDLLPAYTDLTRTDVERAVALREALRALLFAQHDGSAPRDTIATLDGLASGAPLTVGFSSDGTTTLRPAAGGLDGAVAALLAIVHAATIDGTWSRLKACRNETCQWVYFDQSKNRSSAWCIMAACGNRMKSRTYRERHTKP